MSAFMLATVKVKDPVKLQDYLGKVQKLSANYGAQLLAKGKAVRAITEGGKRARCYHRLLSFLILRVSIRYLEVTSIKN